MGKHLTKTGIAGYGLLLAAASISVWSFSYARFTAQENGMASATVAAWGSGSSTIDINGTAAAAPGRHRGRRHAILLSRKPCIGERPYRYACGRKQQAVSCNSGFRQMLSHSYMFPPDCLTIPIISAPQKNCIFPPAL